MLGMAYPATVVALATATSYPPPPRRAAGSGGTRAPQRQPGWCGGQSGTASTAATTTRSRKRCMAGSFFLPTHSTLRPAPPARKSHNHRARETGTTGAGPALVRSMGAAGICGWRTAGQPVVAALWPGSVGRYSVH